MSYEQLEKAWEEGDLETVEAVLAQSCEEQQRDIGSQRRTLLHGACMEGRSAIAEMLIDRGAYVDAKDDCLNTPLHWAAIRGHPAIVRILLMNGANIEAKAKFKSTPLHLACEFGNLAVAEMLLNKGADFEALDEDWKTPCSKWSSSDMQRQYKALVATLDRPSSYDSLRVAIKRRIRQDAAQDYLLSIVKSLYHVKSPLSLDQRAELASSLVREVQSYPSDVLFATMSQLMTSALSFAAFICAKAAQESLKDRPSDQDMACLHCMLANVQQAFEATAASSFATFKLQKAVNSCDQRVNSAQKALEKAERALQRAEEKRAAKRQELEAAEQELRLHGCDQRVNAAQKALEKAERALQQAEEKRANKCQELEAAEQELQQQQQALLQKAETTKQQLADCRASMKQAMAGVYQKPVVELSVEQAHAVVCNISNTPLDIKRFQEQAIDGQLLVDLSMTDLEQLTGLRPLGVCHRVVHCAKMAAATPKPALLQSDFEPGVGQLSVWLEQRNDPIGNKYREKLSALKVDILTCQTLLVSDLQAFEVAPRDRRQLLQLLQQASLST